MTSDGGGRDPGEGSRFRVLGSERPFVGHVVSVRLDRIADGDGREDVREVVEHPGAVGGLVIDEHGRVVLVEQWRQAMGARMLEIVAGKYDVEGEAPEETLRRELSEELGYEGGTLTFMTSFATTPGWSDEVVDLYLVERARPMPADRRPEPDWEEVGLRPVVLPLAEALHAATGRDVGDSKTIVALALYSLYTAGTWVPDPAAGPHGRPAGGAG